MGRENEIPPWTLKPLFTLTRHLDLLFLAVKACDQKDDADERACTLWNTDELGKLIETTPFKVFAISDASSLDGGSVRWINVLLKNA